MSIRYFPNLKLQPNREALGKSSYSGNFWMERGLIFSVLVGNFFVVITYVFSKYNFGGKLENMKLYKSFKILHSGKLLHYICPPWGNQNKESLTSFFLAMIYERQAIGNCF